MKSMILMMTASLAFLAGAAQAEAQEAETQSMFAGPKIGLEVSRSRETLRNNPGGIGNTANANRNGISYRAFAGYDALFGSVVIGAEAGIGHGGRTVTQGGTTGRYSVNPGLTFDASARAGVAVIPELLIYGRGGYRWLQTETTRTPTTGAATVTDRTERGFTWGGGAEYALSRNVSLRAEYNRAHLSRDLRDSRISLGATLRF